jgi:hypothetical protein
MKTIFEVKVKVKIDHTEKMPVEEIKKLANESVFVGGISGGSTLYGCYSTKEISRKINNV